MKSDKISDAMGRIDDALITSAEKSRTQQRKKKSKWIGLIAAVACLCIVIGVVFGKGNPGAGPGNSTHTAYAAAISKAVYPEMAPYPDKKNFVSNNGAYGDDYHEAYDAWKESRRAQMDQPEGYADNLDDFWKATIPQFLSGADGENRVYSPLNVYMALSMLAEITEGESRRQILDLLGSDTIETLRAQVSSVWNANYCKDGAVTSVLANSLWLNENITFHQPTMDILAENYYASSYQGEMGSDELNQKLQNWINEQTGGLLKEQASHLELDPRTVLALASTIYFQARWNYDFFKSYTAEDTFHAPDGDLTCDFMYQKGYMEYYWGEQFSAVTKNFDSNSGYSKMWFILPNENISAEELISDEEIADLLLSDDMWDNRKVMEVDLFVPKFDVVSNIDLINGLRELGIHDVFDENVSDFSPVTTDTEGISISRAEHAARVMVDEEGCTAAAYTVMLGFEAGGIPEEKIDFVLDRPFLFVITGISGLPLFVGIVNQPV